MTNVSSVAAPAQTTAISDRRRGFWSSPFFLFVSCYALSILLWAPTLKAFLIWDDIAIIPAIKAPGAAGWLRCVQPIDNGFIRPATLLLFKICYSLAGTKPQLYHLFALAIQGMVATLTGLLAARLLPGRRWAAPVAALVMTTHYGAFAVATQLSNSCDGIAALGMLLALLQWDKWLQGEASLFGVFAGFAVALSGKELGVVTPALLLLWASGRSEFNHRSGRALLWFWAVAGAYLAVNLWLQVTARISYVNIGAVKPEIKGILPRFLNFVSNTYLPYLTVVHWPVGKVETSNLVLRLFRRLSAILLIGAASYSVSRGRFRLPASLVLCAAVVLFPVAPLRMEPAARFIYSALPFTILAMLSTLVVLGKSARAVGITLMAELWLVFAWSIRWSPSTRGYLRAAQSWQKFVSEVQRESPSWPPLSTITVYTNFAHRGRKHIPTPYGMALFRTFFPDLLADYVSNKKVKATTHVYRFDGHKLIRLENDNTTSVSQLD